MVGPQTRQSKVKTSAEARVTQQGLRYNQAARSMHTVQPSKDSFMIATTPPASIDPNEYRRTMGRFATGVTVLTTYRQDGSVVGMTANALVSVSLDPILMLVCIDNNANILPHILASDRFAFSLLSEAQGLLSNYFAGFWNEEIPPPPFAFSDLAGGPRIERTIAALTCRRYRVDDGGDHRIVLGEVIALSRPEEAARPLIFYEGQYARLVEAED